jgi:hypothetical protein
MIKLTLIIFDSQVIDQAFQEGFLEKLRVAKYSRWENISSIVLSL